VSSLRASKDGLEIVEKAGKKKGWTKTTALWYTEALTTEATLKRFWRQVPIQKETFTQICEVVGVNWEEVLDKILSPGTARTDWEEPIDVSVFYGRTKELADLERLILSDRSRLVVLSGMGGIGKTALVGKVWEQIKGKFDYTIQRSLSTAPPLPELLKDIVDFLSDGEQPEGGVPQLMEYLRKQRCLLVLDNVETIMSTGKTAGSFLSEYQDYSDLIRRVKAEQHKSCLLLISRERPEYTTWFRGEKIGLLGLSGLKKEAEELLKEQGLSGSEKELQTLNTLYGGNPLSLKLISALIQDVFNGRVTYYLKSGTIVVVLSEILEYYFSRLSDLEKQIMVKLAVNSEPSSLSHLIEEISPPSTADLMQAVKSLIDRSLIEKICTEGGDVITFTLPPEVRKYVVKRKFLK